MHFRPIAMFAGATMLCMAILFPGVANSQVRLDEGTNDLVQASASLAGSLPYVGPFLSVGAGLLFKEKEQESPAVTLAKANNYTKSRSINDKIELLSAKLLGYQNKVERINLIEERRKTELQEDAKRVQNVQARNAATGAKIRSLLDSIAKIREANGKNPMSEADRLAILELNAKVARLRSTLETVATTETTFLELVKQWTILGEIIEIDIPTFEHLASEDTASFIPLLGAALNLRLDAYDRLILLEPDLQKRREYMTQRNKLTTEYNAKLNKMIRHWIGIRHSRISIGKECRSWSIPKTPNDWDGEQLNDEKSECLTYAHFVLENGKRLKPEFVGVQDANAFVQELKGKISAWETERFKKRFSMETTTVVKVENFAGNSGRALAEAFTLNYEVPPTDGALVWEKDGRFETKRGVGPEGMKGWKPTGFGYVWLPTAHAKDAVAYYSSPDGMQSARRRNFVATSGSDMKLLIMPHFNPFKLAFQYP